MNRLLPLASLLALVLPACSGTQSTPLVVERCRARVTALSDRCVDDGDEVRACAWERYAATCETSDAAALLAAAECLPSTGCPALSDPGENGRACLIDLHGGSEATPAYDAYAALVTRCGGEPSRETFALAEIIPYLGDDAARFEACAGDACSLDAIRAACADEIPALATDACFE